MRDPGDKNYETGSRGLVNLVSADAEVGAREATNTVVLVERRALVRECFARCLRAASGYTVITFPNVDSWLEVCEDTPASLVLLCLVGKPSEPDAQREITRLCQRGNQLPTILLADVEDPDQVVDAIDRGASGYIPTSVTLEVVIEVMRLVKAGGVFVPASSLIAARRSNSCIATTQQSGSQFTERQAAVVEALRRGKANKIIAYELNMRESTVKVHVRNIMKKLKARNRTEVAVMTNGIIKNGSTVGPCGSGVG